MNIFLVLFVIAVDFLSGGAGRGGGWYPSSANRRIWPNVAFYLSCVSSEVMTHFSHVK